jgi:hypothetical protein
VLGAENESPRAFASLARLLITDPAKRKAIAGNRVPIMSVSNPESRSLRTPRLIAPSQNRPSRVNIRLRHPVAAACTLSLFVTRASCQ